MALSRRPRRGRTYRLARAEVLPLKGRREVEDKERRRWTVALGEL